MEIQYKNRQIRKICIDANEARKAYGRQMAQKIQMRIDELTAAEKVEELEELVQFHIGRCHLLTGDRNGQYAMDLAQPYRLIFIKKGNDIQIAEIQEIVDYH